MGFKYKEYYERFIWDEPIMCISDYHLLFDDLVISFGEVSLDKVVLYFKTKEDLVLFKLKYNL